MKYTAVQNGDFVRYGELEMSNVASALLSVDEGPYTAERLTRGRELRARAHSKRSSPNG